MVVSCPSNVTLRKHRKKLSIPLWRNNNIIVAMQSNPSDIICDVVSKILKTSAFTSSTMQILSTGLLSFTVHENLEFLATDGKICLAWVGGEIYLGIVNRHT